MMQLSFVLLFVVRFPSVLGYTNYAVYYDIEEQENVWGEGFKPKEPKDWDEVEQCEDYHFKCPFWASIGECEKDPRYMIRNCKKSCNICENTWPIFTDWGNTLVDNSRWLKGNQCKDFTSAPYSMEHKQSPITLTEDHECTDRHKMFTLDRGNCSKQEARFYTSAYGLGVDLKGCSAPPVIDHSKNRDPWTLVGISVKVPAEHNIVKNGTVEDFDGEIHLEYKGSGYSGDNIGIVAVLLKASDLAEDDDELKKYIEGWEEVQRKQYADCGVFYNENNCNLLMSDSVPRDNDSDSPRTNATSIPTVIPTTSNHNMHTTASPNPDCSDCNQCCSHRHLLGDVSDRSIAAYGENLVKLVEDQKKEINMLKQALTQCPKDPKRPSHRELGEWHRKCPGSDFCFVNLYKHTKSNYYYRYKGTITVPPCTDGVHWRVMINPLVVAREQIHKLEELTYKHLDRCELRSVGKRRNSESCKVSVNRPRQALSFNHDLRHCDAWVSEGIAMDPDHADNQGFSSGLFQTLGNGESCTASSMCESGCCYKSSTGRNRCRNYKKTRTCI